MSNPRGFQANFSGGRTSPDLDGRVDLEIYATSLGECLNFLPTVEGALPRRPGFLDNGPVLDQTQATRLIPFRVSESDQQMLELGHETMRVWNADGSLVTDGAGAVLVVATGMEPSLVGRLRWSQSNDVLFLTDSARLTPPQVLQRYSLTDWRFAPLRNINGPWRGENSDDAWTIAASGYTGTVTLTASKDTFLPGHVGGLFRLRQTDGSPGVRSWSPGVDQSDDGNDGLKVQLYELQLSDGKVYRANNQVDDATGTTPPIHDKGIVSDGKVDWEYIHDGAGIVKITAVTSPTSATGTVLANLPTLGDGVAGDNAVHILTPSADPAFPATSWWSEGAWSDVRGWPGDVECGEDERLAFSGPTAEPARVDLSRTAGFGPDWVDFHPGLGTGEVLDDDAIALKLAGGRDPVNWLALGAYLTAGTSGRESVFYGAALDEPVKPSATTVRSMSFEGSENIAPEIGQGGVIHIVRGGQGLHHAGISADMSRLDTNLTEFAADLAVTRLYEIAWAGQPSRTLWARNGAAELLSLCYEPRQKVIGWAKHIIGTGAGGPRWLPESLAVITGPDGRDTLWLVGRRDKDGVPHRRVLMLANRWRPGAPLTSAVYLDVAQAYAGPPASVIGGLSHLAGEIVRCWAGFSAADPSAPGPAIDQQLVVAADGTVTLPEAVTDAVIGLPYISTMEIHPVDLQGPAGTAGMVQRILSATVFLADACNAEASSDLLTWEPISGDAWAGDRAPGKVTAKVAIGQTPSRRTTMRVRFRTSAPGTILALRVQTQVND